MLASMILEMENMLLRSSVRQPSKFFVFNPKSNVVSDLVISA